MIDVDSEQRVGLDVAHVVGAEHEAAVKFALNTNIHLQGARCFVVGSEQRRRDVKARRELGANEGRVRYTHAEGTGGLVGRFKRSKACRTLGNGISAEARTCYRISSHA